MKIWIARDLSGILNLCFEKMEIETNGMYWAKTRGVCIMPAKTRVNVKAGKQKCFELKEVNPNGK